VNKPTATLRSSDIYAVGIMVSALTGLLPEQLPKDADTDEIIWHDQAQVSSSSRQNGAL